MTTKELYAYYTDKDEANRALKRKRADYVAAAPALGA